MRKKEIIERIWQIQDRLTYLERKIDKKEGQLTDAIENIRIAIEELKERGDRK